MSNVFVTSDLHLNHINILKYCPETRGHYSSVNHMNEDIVSQWNQQVTEYDTVYILGDVAFGSVHDAVKLLNRMNGRKILVEGNHDKKNLKNDFFRDCFDSVHPYHELIHDGTLVVMFHYPIAEFNQKHRGAVHFHGHLHQKNSGLEHLRIRNVGFDYTGKIVWPIEDAITDALRGEYHESKGD